MLTKRLLICVLAGLVVAPAITKAEDPARFLAVEAWEGKVTHALTENGEFDADGCHISWHANHAANATIKVMPLYFQLPGLAAWQTTAGTNVTYDLTFAEDFTGTCPGEPPGGQSATGDDQRFSEMGNVFGVQIDVTNNTYEVSMVAGIPCEVTIGPNTLDSSTAWVVEPVSFVRPLPAAGMALSGEETIDLNNCTGCGAYFATAISTLTDRLNGTVKVTWNLQPLSTNELKVVIEPLAYDAWIPEGDRFFDQTHRGNTLKVKATLLNKDGTPTTRKAQRFTFELVELSQEPGVCMNYPAAAIADVEADLRFEEELMQPEQWELLDETKTAKTREGSYSTVTAEVSCFDYGAYGKLKVKAEVDGRTIEGVWKADENQEFVLLPKRIEDSKIAEAWINQQNAQSASDEDDEENVPEGDGHKGDGLSVYEEYRGFRENRKHIRTNPWKKDLFIRDEINIGESRRGIGLFEVETGFDVHAKLRAAEITDDNRINFNYGDASRHVVDQHGVRVRRYTQDTGFSRAENLPGRNNNGTPGTKSSVYMIPDLGTGETGAQVLGGNGVARFSRSAQPFFVASLAHEISHCCAVYHHGSRDYKVRWSEVSVSNQVELRENGFTAIQLRWEPSLVCTNYGPYLRDKIGIGADHGQHSGDANCYMRYATAWAYVLKRDPSVRMLVNEVKGLSICTSAAGTVVNADAHQPQSRYGPADTANRRGNCKGQLCVNDLYMDSPDHTR